MDKKELKATLEACPQLLAYFEIAQDNNMNDVYVLHDDCEDIVFTKSEMEEATANLKGLVQPPQMCEDSIKYMIDVFTNMALREGVRVNKLPIN